MNANEAKKLNDAKAKVDTALDLLSEVYDNIEKEHFDKTDMEVLQLEMRLNFVLQVALEITDSIMGQTRFAKALAIMEGERKKGG